MLLLANVHAALGLVATRALVASTLSTASSPRSSAVVAAQSRPLFSFGVIADVQWADSEDGSNFDGTVLRRYRGAFRTLVRAVEWWRALPEAPAFIGQLGDLIDGINVKLGQSVPALEAALNQLGRAPCPAVNIVGNHELYNFDRAQLSRASWLKHGDREYYSFSPAAGWRVVVLDPYQRALIGFDQEDPRRLASVEIMAAENPTVHPSGVGGEWFKNVRGTQRRFVPYNGGLGAEQLEWLGSELAEAAGVGDRVLIFCHVILHPSACGGSTMVWDYEEALSVIGAEKAGGCVAAVLCGHDHFGQYHLDEAGVHHCTFCSPLNLGDEGSAFGLVQVWEDAIEIRSPAVDQLLPVDRGGKPTGRPASTKCEADRYTSECERVRLPLRPPSAARSRGVAARAVDGAGDP